MDEKPTEPNSVASDEHRQMHDVPCSMRMDTSGQYPSIWQAVGLLALFVLFQLVLAVPLAPLALVLDLGTVVCVVNVVACLIVLWWGFRRTQRSLREVFPLASFPIIFLLPLGLAVVGLQILLSEADNATRWVLPMPTFLQRTFSDLAEGGLSSWIALMIVAPLTEEPLCRGLILGGFLRRYPARKALVVSALLFAAVHLNPFQFLSAFVLGILLGWVFLKTRSLLPCIFAHALNNAGGWIARGVLEIEIPGYTSGLGGRVQFQPLWFDALGLSLLAIGLTLMIATLSKDRRN
jgi:membrane protease YdiL (CAAX protease family)